MPEEGTDHRDPAVHHRNRQPTVNPSMKKGKEIRYPLISSFWPLKRSLL